MGKLKVSEIFKVGSTYEILTKYKEVPVKALMKLLWVDDEGRLLGFDWGRTHLRKAFTTLEPVYIKLSPREYAQTQIFSNMGKELVLMVENFVDPPDFIRRRSVRVEPDENNPVMVTIEYNGKSITVPAKDISETGVGVIIHRDEHRDFIDFVNRELENLKQEHHIEFKVKIHLPNLGTVDGIGKIRNLIGTGKDIYMRVGFELEFTRSELAKIRKYVMNRQKEIIQSLRMLE